MMYGTLGNKRESQENLTGSASLHRRSPSPLATSEYQPGSSDEDPEKQRRIYSHCHVQKTRGDPSMVDGAAKNRLIVASVVCLTFMVTEVIGGVLSNSLAIATDAAHLLTDFASFMVSLFAIWLASRPASRSMSFGWYRAEVIGALISVLMIWLVTGVLVYMAVERLWSQEFSINSTVMVITASLGLLVNLIMALVLNVGCDSHHHFHAHGHGHGHGHISNHNHLDCGEIKTSTTTKDLEAGGSKTSNSLTRSDKSHPKDRSNSSSSHRTSGRGKSNINVQAALIHVIGDFLQSLGVLIAALVIHFKPEYSIVDPICTFIFAIIVLATTFRIIRVAVNVLMEGTPDNINFIEVRETLQQLPCVIRVHNLRIWSLSLDKIAISAHLVINNSQTPSDALKQAVETLKSNHNFFEVTIQVEEFKEDMKDCQDCQDEEIVDTNGETTSNVPLPIISSD